MSDHEITVPGLPRWHPDSAVRKTIDRVREFGWAIVAISDICEECIRNGESPEVPECTFGYSVGASLRGTPELAVYGLPPQETWDLLDELVERLSVHDWKQLVDGGVELTTETLDVPVRLVEMIDTLDLIHARAVFPNVPALQVVWADEHGHYPWEDDYSLPADAQQFYGFPDATPGTRPTGPRIIRSGGGPNRAQRRTRRRRRR
jgi:hypothetical protein